MQIHELTQPRLNEGIASALGGLVGHAQAGANALTHKLSGSGNYQAAKQDPVRQQQIKMLSDKTYRAWKSYEKDLLRSNPDARETGMYEQALMAFVNKNMLGGVYLPNVINQQQIRQLVAQLSQPTGVTEAEVTGAAKPGAPTAAEREKLQQRIQAATGNAKPKANPKAKTATGNAKPKAGAASANKPSPGAGAFGQMASQLGDTGATSTGGQSQATPTGVKHTASPNNPNQPKATATATATPEPATTATAGAPPGAPPGTPAATPAQQPATKPAPVATPNEKDLWLKLTQQTAIAQNAAPGGTSSQTSASNQSSTTQTSSNSSKNMDAREMAQRMRQELPEELIRNFPAASRLAQQLTGDLRATSTGNPAADALLILMGFQGL